MQIRASNSYNLSRSERLIVHFSDTASPLADYLNRRVLRS